MPQFGHTFIALGLCTWLICVDYQLLVLTLDTPRKGYLSVSYEWLLSFKYRKPLASLVEPQGALPQTSRCFIPMRTNICLLTLAITRCNVDGFMVDWGQVISSRTQATDQAEQATEILLPSGYCVVTMVTTVTMVTVNFGLCQDNSEILI